MKYAEHVVVSSTRGRYRSHLVQGHVNKADESFCKPHSDVWVGYINHFIVIFQQHFLNLAEVIGKYNQNNSLLFP